MIRYWVLLLVLGYLTVIVILALLQRRLIFHPDTNRPGPPPTTLANTASLEITTQDGLALTCWFMRPATAGAAVVLFLHGNAGHLGYKAGRLHDFERAGWGALLVGYRGYGGNEGSPSERGLLADARAGLGALLGMGILAKDILIWGESLGTGVAVQLAAEASVGGLVLEAPFTSLTDMARLKFSWAPAGLFLRDRFDSLARITDIHCPLFVLAGESDTLVPPAMSRRLFASANEPKMFRLQKMAGHNDVGTPDAADAVARFLRDIGALQHVR